MSFWGIEVKPAKPHPYHSDNVQGKLCVTQATLGLGSSKERTILQCSVGRKSPVFLCSLLPGKFESCSLNLEFTDELVAFSVIGPRSVHLCGYFKSDEGENLRDEYDIDSSGEDIGETESDESSEFDYDDDYDEDFIDDDGFEFIPSSPVPNRGVVIEEIVDEDKPTNGDGQPERPKKKKKKKSSDNGDGNQNNSERQIVVKRDSGADLLQSEDEDGFPISPAHKSEEMVQELPADEDDLKAKETKTGDRDDDAGGKKRKVKTTDHDGQSERKIKKKKQKEGVRETNTDEMQKEGVRETNTDEMHDDEKINALAKDEIQPEEVTEQETPDRNEEDRRALDSNTDGSPQENTSDKKKKKKKKKKNKNQDVPDGTSKDSNPNVVDKSKSPVEAEEKQSAGKASQVRTFANGLVIEELAIGKPDGQRASPGTQVSVIYIGKLKKNGKIFDTNVGRAPFKFRLGVGQVIKGWDIGVNGMRVGDKRRLTIPPSMGYGDKGAGGKIPPNAWLVFDVELVNVR